MGCLGELAVRRGVVRILVRVVLLGQLAIGGLDVLLACGPRHPKYGVRIAHRVQSLIWGIVRPVLEVLYGHAPGPCPVMARATRRKYRYAADPHRTAL
ncbi:hypothetical protein D3C72_2022850 [compost metagenome]